MAKTERVRGEGGQRQSEGGGREGGVWQRQRE